MDDSRPNTHANSRRTKRHLAQLQTYTQGRPIVVNDFADRNQRFQEFMQRRKSSHDAYAAPRKQSQLAAVKNVTVRNIANTLKKADGGKEFQK